MKKEAKSNGVDWLIKNKRDLIDAEFVLNQDGGGCRNRKRQTGDDGR